MSSLPEMCDVFLKFGYLELQNKDYFSHVEENFVGFLYSSFSGFHGSSRLHFVGGSIFILE